MELALLLRGSYEQTLNEPAGAIQRLGAPQGLLGGLVSSIGTADLNTPCKFFMHGPQNIN